MKKLLILVIFTLSFSLNLPKSFKANFIQTIKSNNKTLIYKGEIYYKNGKIFWKYTYPIEKYIWINEKVYIYEPNLYQVTITKRPKINLISILKHAKKIKDNLYKATINNKEIKFVYDSSIKEISYIDDVGNKIKIVFSNYSKEVNNSIFTPNYPNDVDIIHQR